MKTHTGGGCPAVSEKVWHNNAGPAWLVIVTITHRWFVHATGKVLSPGNPMSMDVFRGKPMVG